MPPVPVTMIHSLHPHDAQLAVPFVNCPTKGGGEAKEVVDVAVHPFESVIVTE